MRKKQSLHELVSRACCRGQQIVAQMSYMPTRNFIHIDELEKYAACTMRKQTTQGQWADADEERLSRIGPPTFREIYRHNSAGILIKPVSATKEH
ncbi:hypothetical protein M514_02865 [Trichuris suis]|uniref:Uncharacterized protein n=1 Tax=Trichuris suis TaxID=68888 RepID=A0A085NAW9_9BILA|nr:hypothetical protein M513_02865 [Trichuris suis]KFD66615.1 hypothetical protein M514_02865 [Trichuris suis]